MVRFIFLYVHHELNCILNLDYYLDIINLNTMNDNN